MRDAADLVRTSGSVLGDDQDALVRRLNQNVDNRIQRQSREILRSGNASDTVRDLKAAADDLRLRPPEIPAPYPEISVDDVRLLVWMAIHPG